MICKILSPFPSQPHILITGRGVNTEVINTEEFVVSPYENYHNLGVVLGYVKVLKSTFQPGCFVKASDVTETSPGSNTLVVCKEAEFPHNKGV